MFSKREQWMWETGAWCLDEWTDATTDRSQKTAVAETTEAAIETLCLWALVNMQKGGAWCWPRDHNVS